MSVKPITPKEVAKLQAEILPDVVIDVVNRLIAENMDGLQAVVLQKDIVDRVKDQHGTFSQKWLNFEPLFRRAGWKVTYAKPAYNETYEPTFTFTAPRMRG